MPGAYTLEDGQRRIRFAPANLLAADTTFTVVVTNQLRDLAGNSVINPGSFTFTTGADSDTTAPFVVSSTPAYFEDNVGRLPVIRVVFSEPINSITVNSSTFYLYNTVTGGYARATAHLSSDRMSATLRPDAPLEPYTYYFYFVCRCRPGGQHGRLRRHLLPHRRRCGHHRRRPSSRSTQAAAPRTCRSTPVCVR